LLAPHRTGSRREHNGVTVSQLPNLFLVYGPNTSLGPSSIVYMLESKAEHVSQLIELAPRGPRGTIEVRDEVMAAYADRMDRELAGTVWNDGGCSSWYIDSRGRNSLQWPTFTYRYRDQVTTIDPTEYVLA